MKSILVMHTEGWTESILSSFMVPALKEKYPQARVTLVLSQSLRDWTPCIHFDDLILFDERHLGKNTRTMARLYDQTLLTLKLRGKKYDLAVNLNRVHSFRTTLKIAGVKKVVEDTHSSIHPSGEWGSLSEIDRNLGILSQLDIQPQKLNFKLKVRQHIHEEIMLRLARLGVRSGAFLAVAPGATLLNRSFKHRRWNFFPEFFKIVLERTPWPILLLGGMEERELAATLIPYNTDRVFSWIGETTREEALATVGEAAAFVGNDSGVSHAAGSTGVPSVILYGPSSFKMRHPPGTGKNVTCLQSGVPCSPCQKNDGAFAWDCRENVCMNYHSPEAVWKALSNLTKIKN